MCDDRRQVRCRAHDVRVTVSRPGRQQWPVGEALVPSDQPGQVMDSVPWAPSASGAVTGRVVIGALSTAVVTRPGPPLWPPT